MANKITTYDDFCDRAFDLAPWLYDFAGDDQIMLTSAWEACAQFATLTDDRIRDALDDRRGAN